MPKQAPFLQSTLPFPNAALNMARNLITPWINQLTSLQLRPSLIQPLQPLHRVHASLPCHIHRILLRYIEPTSITLLQKHTVSRTFPKPRHMNPARKKKKKGQMNERMRRLTCSQTAVLDPSPSPAFCCGFAWLTLSTRPKSSAWSMLLIASAASRGSVNSM